MKNLVSLMRNFLKLNCVMNKKVREVIFYKDYFFEFISTVTLKVKEKIDWTIKLIENIENIPVEYFKHIEGTDGLYEIRVQFGSNIFRIFSFFDEGKIVVLANGFQKKSQKTPTQEIKRALKIKEEYEKEK
jgi:phage-related protein